MDLNKKDIKIYMLSDNHLLADELAPPHKTGAKLDGRIQDNDYMVVERFVDIVNKNRPDAVCFTGDMTYNGELASHKEFVRLFGKISGDIPVCIIPGNHDIYMFHKAKSLVTGESVPSITPLEFKELYYNFGFRQAVSHDKDTLSYLARLNDNCHLLMLDTTPYDENNLPAKSYLTQNTLNWIESCIKNHSGVISFAHHTLVQHTLRPGAHQAITNADELIKLYNRYKVKLHICGHIHKQSVRIADGIYDITNGNCIQYPGNYSILTINDDEYKYDAVSLLSDDELTKQFRAFVDAYVQRNPAIEKTLRDFVCRLQAYYFAGDYITVKDIMNKNPELTCRMNPAEWDSKHILDLLNIKDSEVFDQAHIKIPRKQLTPA